MSRLWRNYGLSVTLVGLFLVSWALQTWMGWAEFVVRTAERTAGDRRLRW